MASLQAIRQETFRVPSNRKEKENQEGRKKERGGKEGGANIDVGDFLVNSGKE